MCLFFLIDTSKALASEKSHCPGRTRLEVKGLFLLISSPGVSYTLWWHLHTRSISFQLHWRPGPDFPGGETSIPVAVFSLTEVPATSRLSIDQYRVLYLRSSQNNYLLTWLSDQRNEPLVTPQHFSALGSPQTPLPPQVFHPKSSSCSETENHTVDMEFSRKQCLEL